MSSSRVGIGSCASKSFLNPFLPCGDCLILSSMPFSSSMVLAASIADFDGCSVLPSNANLSVLGNCVLGVTIGPSLTISPCKPRVSGVIASRLMPWDSIVNTPVLGTGSFRSTKLSCIGVIIPRRCISAVSACVPRTLPRTPASANSTGGTGCTGGNSAVGICCIGCFLGNVRSVFSNTCLPAKSTVVRFADSTPLAPVFCASASIPFQSRYSASVALPALTLSFSEIACSLLYPLTLVPLPRPAKSAPNKASSAIVPGLTSPPVIPLTPVPTPAPIPADTPTALAISSAARFAPSSANKVFPAWTSCAPPTVPATTAGAYSPAVA